MGFNEATQTDITMARRNINNNNIKEEIDLLRKRKEYVHKKKLQEQKEMRDMLESYYPWSTERVKPRGYKNLRLDELFPNNDYLKSKRSVGLIDWGKAGGGAPMANMIKTREDPILRFQFGKDLRKSVDNNLRYRTNRKDQELYKKQLDLLVEEKKQRNLKDKHEVDEAVRKQFLKTPPWGKKGPGGRNWRHPNAVGLNFLKSLGWSNEKTLAALEEKSQKFKNDVQKTYENIKKFNTVPYNKPVKLEPMVHLPRRNNKLPPLSNENDNGVELVTLLAKERRYPPKIPLATTDITSEKKLGKLTLWNREGSAYLRELTNQIKSKQQYMKKIRLEENENVNRHFTTWESFWGRPGHGAPLPEIKKQCLNQLLYPRPFPVPVH